MRAALVLVAGLVRLATCSVPRLKPRPTGLSFESPLGPDEPEAKIFLDSFRFLRS
jgi:hypothetical protein